MADADPLARYRAKRDFGQTAEPAGEVTPKQTEKLRFIVQKHDATRLHWDFRLELDGVLKSWAVTRGPSLDPDEKRLAVRTEDHPLSYADFEGTIPKGQYGGGTVMLWDAGVWAPIKGKSAKDLEKGHLHFTLEGERMKGDWLLIRLKPRGKEKNENWLLRKIDDGFAGGSDELVETGLTSITTGRTMQEIAEGKKTNAVKKAGKLLPGTGGAAQGSGAVGRGTATRSGVVEGGARAGEPSRQTPSTTGSAGGSPPRAGEELGRKTRSSRKLLPAPPFQPLQLATLVDAVPTGNGWLHEVKYDGYRALLSIGEGGPRVFTRSGLDWSDKFPGIVDAARALPVRAALIDGEICAFKDGKPDFSTLQEAISNGGEGLTLFAFDLLHLDGESLTDAPLAQRKERLRPLFAGTDARLQYAEHIVGAGEKLFEAMCGQGYEGVVSKRADAPYRGSRSKGWLKIKCTRRQEFVVVGWNASTAKARGFGSLLLGVNGPDGLRYAGKVGTGFDAATIDRVRAKLDALAVDTPAVSVPRAAARGARWVRPELVAEVAFAEFTAEDVVRHASFIGLREDKKAQDVVVEKPAPAPARAAAKSAVPVSKVKISNPDRVIFPEDGITKGELAAFYAQVSPVMLPWAASRPISLVRCPQGRAKACFFQKHDAGSFGDTMRHVDILEKDGHTEPYLYLDDLDGLMACVQMGTIEFHGWGSLVADVEKPDRLVFDLDPDEGLDFSDVKRAAEDLKQHLADIGLTSVPMLSGGKGIHVIVPLQPQAEWPAVKSFADRFARALSAAEPDRFVAVMSKAKRKGRIFIDWLRNQRGATAVLPYVARARPGAPVAAPVTWSELKDITTAARWTVRDADELVERANGRALSGWGASAQVLPDL